MNLIPNFGFFKPFFQLFLYQFLFLLSWSHSQERCELTFKECIQMGASGLTDVIVPSNVTRINQDAISICVSGSTTRPKVNIMFVVDQSGSMATQDANYYAYDATQIAIQNVKDLSPASLVGLMPFATEICRNENQLFDLNNPVEYQQLLVIAQNDIADGEGPAEDPNASNWQNLPGTDKLGCGAARNGVNQEFGTNYRDPLDSAYKVLRSAPTGEAVAVIFITDGEPSDVDQWNNWNGKYAEIPVHSIFIGGSQNGAEANRLRDLGDNTGSPANRGSYNPIQENDSLALVNILDAVIKSVLEIKRPIQSTVENPSVGKTATIDSASHDSVDTDLYQLNMSLPMAVNEGLNAISISTVHSDGQNTSGNFNHVINLNVSGSLGSQPDSLFNITCSNVSQLSAHSSDFNQSITQVSANDPQFGVRLTNADQNLGSTNVNILSALSSDSELVSLATSGQNYQGTVNLGISNVTKGNGTVEFEITGDVLNIRWQHPEDPRDTATLQLPVIDGRSAAEAEIAYIYDVNNDGHGDRLVIEFKDSLMVIPDTIYDINWPGDSSNLVIAVNGVDEFTLDPTGTQLIINFADEKVMEFGKTSVLGSPTLTLPANAIFNGAVVEIVDRMGPVITSIDKISAENSGYFEVVPGDDPGTIDTVPKTFPDTLVITLSEELIAIPNVEDPWSSLLIYLPKGSNEYDTVRIMGPPIKVDSLTWKVLIPEGGAQGVPLNGEMVSLNPEGSYTDSENNIPVEVTVETIHQAYDPKNIHVRIINPVVGDDTYDNYSLCEDSTLVKVGDEFVGKTDKCTEEYVILPHGLDEFGNVDPSVQQNCKANGITLEEKELVQIDNNCLIMIRVITENGVPYDAKIQIYDHLGLAINSFSQPNGFCGEFEEQRLDRRTIIDGKTSYKSWLVWNQKDFKGEFVNSGVFIWKVFFKFADGRGQTKIFRSGIARSDEPEMECWVK